MKYKIIVFLALFFSLHGMDAPLGETETVPVKLHDLHNKEQRKFKKYDLEHPEKFLVIMREQFNYNGDKETYLKRVQTLASALLAQHYLAQYLGEVAYFTHYHSKLRNEYYQLLHRLHVKSADRDKDMAMLNPETAEQLNILLAHPETARGGDRIFSQEELAVIFSWIFDIEKGTWLNNFGLLQKNVHENTLAYNKLMELRNKLENIVSPVPGTPFENPEQLIKDNIPYVSRLFSSYETLQASEANASSEEMRNKAIFEYEQNNAQLAQLYRIMQPFYQKLYIIVRKELYEAFNKALQAKVKNITPLFVLPIPEQLRKTNAIPAKFPEELPTIANPSTYLTLPSLNTDLENARIEFEKAKTTQPPKKKRWHRPKGKFSLELPEGQSAIEPTVAPVSVEPKKIREASDKSFIVEDGEDDLQIIIEDPAHDSTVTIFKTKSSPANSTKLKSLPKVNYTHSVNEWFRNPKKARVEQGYTDPKNPRYRAGEPEWKPIILHAFPQLVDEYIYKYGSVSQTPSRMVKGKNDIMVTIPGKMEYPDDKQETGVFTYIIDPTNGQWFHRMFTPSSHKKMAGDFMEKGYFAPEVKGYYDVYFPPLAPKEKTVLP